MKYIFSLCEFEFFNKIIYELNIVNLFKSNSFFY